MANKQFTKTCGELVKSSRFRNSSALILTMVLTSLLAIVGVLFVLVSQLDKMATSGLSENKELNYAVETVIAKISQKLVLDVPGVADANEEYYDYPDANNAWLACLEPNVDTKGTSTTNDDVYYWPQISNITGTGVAWTNLQAKIINDYEPNIVADANADADGDGVSDSVWVKVPDITSSKGKPIYAAVRIIDNGGMLNVNTDYKFDPNDTDPTLINGSSQMQVNLAALSQRGVSNGTLDTAADKLQDWRCGNESNNLTLYKQNVIWQYYNPNGTYTPFDIGDELKLRNRYILNYNKITTRIERLWTKVYDWGLYDPRTEPGKLTSEPNYWFYRAYYGSSDPNIYDYRHISTTYNMDRSIGPDGGKMVNVNRVDGNDSNNVTALYLAIRAGFQDAGFVGPIAIRTAVQTAVNLIDYRDSDDNVTPFPFLIFGNRYYGFEQPCIYISELAHNFTRIGPNVYRSYAIELYKPYEDKSPVGWRLVVGGTTIDINNPTWNSDKSYYVIRNENSNAKFPIPPDPNKADIKNTSFSFSGGNTVTLQRRIPDGNYITVDSKPIPAASGNWLNEVSGSYGSIQRDITKYKCIRRLWDTNVTTPTLGNYNGVTVGSTTLIQAHPANSYFIKNIGEIGMILRKSAYSQGPNPIGPNDTEVTTRINLEDPNFQKVFNYLTVFPSAEYVSDPNETRIKGRININTAPWFVLAQLPWVSQRKSGYNNTALVQAIIAYRDKGAVPGGDPNYSNRAGNPGLKSIGELNNIIRGSNSNYRMDYYALDTNDLTTFPDLTPNEGVVNDFEERDVIFARISNLVTVRSDVFTAYILVRIGNDGPQKRVMAILDRSNAFSPGGKVRIVALHQVPDPR